MADGHSIPCKQCRLCGETKPITDFHGSSKHSLGVRNECRLCAKSRAKVYYDANRTARIDYSKKRNSALAEEIASKRKLNKDHHNKVSRAWGSRNPEKRRERKARRRAAGPMQRGSVSFLMKAQRGMCACCRKSISNGVYHLDHITAIANGGTNARSNLQLLCPPCNLAKSARDPIEFMQSRGFLC